MCHDLIHVPSQTALLDTPRHQHVSSLDFIAISDAGASNPLELDVRLVVPR